MQGCAAKLSCLWSVIWDWCLSRGSLENGGIHSNACKFGPAYRRQNRKCRRPLMSFPTSFRIHAQSKEWIAKRRAWRVLDSGAGTKRVWGHCEIHTVGPVRDADRAGTAG